MICLMLDVRMRPTLGLLHFVLSSVNCAHYVSGFGCVWRNFTYTPHNKLNGLPGKKARKTYVNPRLCK